MLTRRDCDSERNPGAYPLIEGRPQDHGPGTKDAVTAKQKPLYTPRARLPERRRALSHAGQADSLQAANEALVQLR
jgi:hypothetical protein